MLADSKTAGVMLVSLDSNMPVIRWLTGVAAGGGAVERAEAFACAHVHRAICSIRRS